MTEIRCEKESFQHFIEDRLLKTIELDDTEATPHDDDIKCQSLT